MLSSHINYDTKFKSSIIYNNKEKHTFPIKFENRQTDGPSNFKVGCAIVGKNSIIKISSVSLKSYFPVSGRNERLMTDRESKLPT